MCNECDSVTRPDRCAVAFHLWSGVLAPRTASVRAADLIALLPRLSTGRHRTVAANVEKNQESLRDRVSWREQIRRQDFTATSLPEQAGGQVHRARQNSEPEGAEDGGPSFGRFNMRKHGSIPRTVLGALVLVTLGSTGEAWAQNCIANPNDAANCFHLKGSDTLFDIMTDAINAARTAGVVGADKLFYDGTGSGNAESQMRFVGGSQPGGNANLGVQSIGPMSRNFRPGVIDNLSVGFNQRTGTNLTGNGHALWAPSCQNVIGLDAAVLLTRATGAGAGCRNINFNTFNDTTFPGASVPRATTNNAALPVLFGNGSAFNNLASTSNYSNLLMIILSGVDGSGSIAACSDPRRIQAVQDLAGCMGVDHIEHLYRRDDNSGTTDTWKDRIMTIPSTADPRYAWVGGRFCNNQSIGGINGAANQTGICAITRTNNTCKVSTDCPLISGST